MARRGGAQGGPIGKVLWAFFVASVAFAIIGDPTVGAEQFRTNLEHRADRYKSIVEDITQGGGLGAPPKGGSGPGAIPSPGSTWTLPAKPGPKDAVKGLDALPVSGSTASGYKRDDWPHWTNVRSCWTVREQVLARDAVKGSLVLKDRNGNVTADVSKACSVESGKWKDPFSTVVLTSPRDVDIDHIVPLAEAHRTGGAGWSRETKTAYANYLDDPNHLRATAATFNRQKGDQTPATWMPIDRSTHCWYATSWIKIKTDWKLTISRAEKSSLQDMLATCK